MDIQKIPCEPMIQEQIRQVLQNFKCIRLHFTAEALEDIHFSSYMGSTIRGAFGVALKRSVCVTKQNQCSACMLQHSCVYSYIFETPIPADSHVMKKQTHVPHPFSFSDMSDLHKHEYASGEIFRFSLCLMGKSIDFLPYCIYAMIRLGQFGMGRGRGRFKLLHIQEMDAHHQCCDDIYVDDQLHMPQHFLSIETAEALMSQYVNSKHQITLDFISPFRIKYQNKLCDHVAFHILIRSLMRRLANLAYFHSNSRVHLDFNEIIEKARSVRISENNMTWYDWGRYSTRQKEWMNFGGLVGDITYEGDIRVFIPLLILGSWVNVGKGTAFGLGNYRLC